MTISTNDVKARVVEKLVSLGGFLLYRDRKLIQDGRIEEAMDRIRNRFAWVHRVVWLCSVIVIGAAVYHLAVGRFAIIQLAAAALAVWASMSMIRQKRRLDEMLAEAKELLESHPSNV